MNRKVCAVMIVIALLAFAAISSFAEGSGATPSPSVTTEDGYTVEISKAYFTNDSVFIWYKLNGDTTYTELHEGAPDKDIQWKYVFEDTISAEQWSADNPLLQAEFDWLDGKGQRWTFDKIAGIEDGIELEDGKYADIIAGEEAYLEDGTISGWKECKMPAVEVSDTMTFKLVLSRSQTTRFQDGTTYKELREQMNQTYILIKMGKNDPYQHALEVSCEEKCM